MSDPFGAEKRLRDISERDTRYDIPERIWTLDPTRTFNLRIGNMLIWIAPRPHYCDGGHWYAGCEGIPNIDNADTFPRYYMDLIRAKAEMYEWLEWRIKCGEARP